MIRNKAASYAVLAMVDIARRRQEPGAADVQANDIASRFGLPMAYTAKVLSQLARASLLRSGRGPRGGFQLARAPDEITLLQILNAARAWNDDILSLSASAPAGVRRGVTEALGQAADQAKGVLDRIRLSDLMAETPG
jgi:Rrf2 family protein